MPAGAGGRMVAGVRVPRAHPYSPRRRLNNPPERFAGSAAGAGSGVGGASAAGASSVFGFAVLRVLRLGLDFASGSSPLADDATPAVSVSALGFAGARRRRGLGAGFTSASGAAVSADASGSSPLADAAAVVFFVRLRPPRVPRRRFGLAAASSPSAGVSATAASAASASGSASVVAFVLDRDAAGFASADFFG